MWNRDEAVKPAGPAGSGPSQTTSVNTPPAAESVRTTSAPSEPLRGMERTTVNIGKSVVIKGELNGSEDLTVEGHVEGKIELRDHVLTIGPNGKIRAEDHRVVHDAYLAQVKPAGEVKEPWDYVRIVKTIPAAQAFRAPSSDCRM